MTINETKNGLLTVGSTQSFGAGLKDICLIKTENTGNTSCSYDKVELKTETYNMTTNQVEVNNKSVEKVSGKQADKDGGKQQTTTLDNEVTFNNVCNK
jgi:hypothetical protein